MQNPIANNAAAVDAQTRRCLRRLPLGQRATDQRRYAGMHRIALVTLLSLFSLLLLGCPARWKVVSINGAEQSLSVKLSGALDGSQAIFTISQGDSHSELLGHVQRLGVFDASGTLLFQRDEFGSRDLAPPFHAKYPHIYVLLTTTNAYVIPENYSKTWREHIDEITAHKQLALAMFGAGYREQDEQVLASEANQTLHRIAAPPWDSAGQESQEGRHR